MIELIKTTNPVRVSFLRAVLADAGIESFVADAGAASLWGTTIPARLMVAEADLARAYKSQVDPRLNAEQALELAMLIARRAGANRRTSKPKLA